MHRLEDQGAEIARACERIAAFILGAALFALIA